jgi:hypothetical protein
MTRELVLECVASPSYQSDSRGDYYARLLLAVGADARSVEEIVVADEPEDGRDDGCCSLGLDVLVRMGVRGDLGAQEAVRRYLTAGARWPRLLDGIEKDYERTATDPSWRSTVERLGAVLCERFNTPERLRAELEARLPWIQEGDVPWSSWAAENPALAEAMRASESDRGDSPPRPVPDLGSLSTAGLLAIDDDHLVRDAARVLRERTSGTDVRLLLAAARDPSVVMRAPAIEALAHQQRLEVLDIAAEIPGSIRPRWIWAFTGRALMSLPFDRTRSLTYDWLQSDLTTRRRTAGSLLKAHATERDIPTIREYLRREKDDGYTGDEFVVWDLAAALARHPQHGPYRELTSAFYGLSYPLFRRDVAQAIAATDPGFDRTVGLECLWDCEPEVRTFGIAHSNLDDPMVNERLRDMACDWAEDAETQQAAQARLNEPPGRATTSP